MTGFDVVTGAFSYSGAAIAQELQAAGRRVRTLTGHPGRGPQTAVAGGDIEVRPLDFADPAALTESMRGAGTLYNTYWVRFAHGSVDHPVAVARSRVLFQAAAEAGVRRIVHVSITNPSADSPYPYFRGKAAVEQALRDLGVSHAVLRPAILFGGDGVLLNNMAWLLRRLPVFAVGGTGEYRIRPIHVDDLARLAVRAGDSAVTEVIDAVGPERPTFLALVQTIRAAVGSRSQVIRVPG
ncbi:MAG TPA: NAD(P)H-binding protein, partial [Streptosporangiaceae bacterium]|nr:NAD(P)H-binding protein [Streptosporangiaceae bacterium]